MKILKSIVLLIFFIMLAGTMNSCATPQGALLRHERKIARIKVDSIRASKTTVNRTTTDYNYWNPQWSGVNNWYWNGNRFYRPQVIIPVKINKRRRNGNNTNINPRRMPNRRGVSRVVPKPKRSPKVVRPQVPVRRPQPNRPTRRVSGPRGGKKNTQ